MKKTITIILLLLVVIACKNENNPLNKIKDVVDNAKEMKQDIENVTSVTKNLEDVQENIKRLSKLTPISKEQIKAWMPNEIGNLKRTEFKINKQMGISLFELKFKNEDNKKISLTITDGAGNAAPMMSMYTALQNMEMDNESENGYERTQKFHDQNVYIKYQKSSKHEKSELKAMLNNRFGVEANAWNMTPEDLWAYIKQLEIEKLIK